jgi:hypothetical protein
MVETTVERQAVLRRPIVVGYEASPTEPPKRITP